MEFRLKLWKMLKDKNVAWGSKAIGALLYLVSPIDVIPDLIDGNSVFRV